MISHNLFWSCCSSKPRLSSTNRVCVRRRTSCSPTRRNTEIMRKQLWSLALMESDVRKCGVSVKLKCLKYESDCCETEEKLLSFQKQSYLVSSERLCELITSISCQSDSSISDWEQLLPLMTGSLRDVLKGEILSWKLIHTETCCKPEALTVFPVEFACSPGFWLTTGFGLICQSEVDPAAEDEERRLKPGVKDGSVFYCPTHSILQIKSLNPDWRTEKELRNIQIINDNILNIPPFY